MINMHLVVSATSIAAQVDNPSFTLNYLATGGTPTTTDVQTLCVNVGNSMGLASGGALHPISAYWAQTISRTTNMCSVTGYSLDGHLNGSPHGGPVAGANFTAAAAATPLTFAPEGVAATVTFQADYGSDVEFAPGARPRSRDRGRIYFGPIGPGNVLGQDSSDNHTIFSSNFIQDMLKNFHGLTTYTSGAITWTLCVWSRKNAILKPVIELWVDDRPDYQRRRADEPGKRSYLAVP